MPISPTTFTHSKALDPLLRNRAYADVVLTDATGKKRSATIQCLVDTGSDYTILPLSAATAAGIVPSGPLVTFRTANGSTFSVQTHANVRLLVEGYSIIGPVAFSTAAGFIPILGRLELVSAFDVGFDLNQWYWD